MEENNDNPLPFPPGYRFMPTDQELVLEYLAKKVNNQPIPVAQIYDVELYTSSPFELSEKYPPLGDKEWYFFTPRDRKYPKGNRPKRSVGEELGYWKATGADKKIRWKGQLVGKKNVLVFYLGKPKNEDKKTNWIMHEYMLNAPSKSPALGKRLDDWVLCRIYEKVERMPNRKPKNVEDDDEDDIVPLPQLEDAPPFEEPAPDNVVPLVQINDENDEIFGGLDTGELHGLDSIVSFGSQNYDHWPLMIDHQIPMNYSDFGSNQLLWSTDSIGYVDCSYGLQEFLEGYSYIYSQQQPRYDRKNMGSQN